jgi:hypothetical protein
VLLSHRPSLVLEFNAARYADAGRFLLEIMSCYRQLRLVAYDGSLVPIAAERILTEKVGEDWLLFFQGAAG